MATVDRLTLRSRIGLRNGWMKRLEGVGELKTGTTSGAGAADGSTIVDTRIYSTARDQFVRQRDIIAITSGARRGDRRVATGPPSSAGVVTVSPTFGAQIASGVNYEVWDADGAHPDLVDSMIDLALREDCWRWLRTPITYVPYGDFGEELAVSGSELVDGSTTAWAGTNATPSLVALTPPTEYVRRALRVTATAANGYMESQALDVDVDNRDSWWVHALVRALATAGGNAGGAATLVLRDLTNGADITPDEALTWTRRGWGLIESSFTIPADCNKIALRLQADANTEIADWAWVQAWPIGQRRFSLPPRIASKDWVGSVFVRKGTIFDEFRPEPWTGGLERRDVGGTGVSLYLNHAPQGRSIWFYEKDSFPTITSAPPVAADDDNTTWAVAEWVIAAAEYEIYKALARRDWKEAPGRWDERLRDAAVELGVFQERYGAEPMFVEDRPQPSYVATERV